MSLLQGQRAYGTHSLRGREESFSRRERGSGWGAETPRGGPQPTSQDY